MRGIARQLVPVRSEVIGAQHRRPRPTGGCCGPTVSAQIENSLTSGCLRWPGDKQIRSSTRTLPRLIRHFALIDQAFRKVGLLCGQGSLCTTCRRIADYAMEMTLQSMHRSSLHHERNVDQIEPTGQHPARPQVIARFIRPEMRASLLRSAGRERVCSCMGRRIGDAIKALWRELLAQPTNEKEAAGPRDHPNHRLEPRGTIDYAVDRALLSDYPPFATNADMLGSGRTSPH